MGATSMGANSLNPKTLSASPLPHSAYPKKDLDFLAALEAEFPSFCFKFSNRFRFHPPKTIFLGPPQPYFALQTLHELGHGLSNRYDYKTHVERLNIESEAWQWAKKLCLKHPEWSRSYGVAWDETAENFAEAMLDTYRDWLHQKSTCKNCGLTRVQTPDGHYHCPLCDLL